jgi:phage terminase small subunit
VSEKKLTAKQQRFVDEYLIDLNATQAAIRAGYSKKTAYVIGHENLRKPEIADAIKAKREKVAEKADLSVDWVLNRLRTVAERCMQAEPVLDKRGWPVLVETPSGELVPAYTFQAAPANRSLELLGKHLGMFPDKVEHTGKDGGPIQTEELGDTERARRIAFVLQNALAKQSEQKLDS